MPHTAWATTATATTFSPCSQPASADAERPHAVGERDERDRRRQGEAEPRREPAEQAGAHHAERDPDLAARRAGQELAERDEVGVGALVEPAAPHDELVAEIAEVRDRPAERGEAQAQRGAEDLEQGRVIASSVDSRAFAGGLALAPPVTMSGLQQLAEELADLLRARFSATPLAA